MVFIISKYVCMYLTSTYVYMNVCMYVCIYVCMRKGVEGWLAWVRKERKKKKTDYLYCASSAPSPNNYGDGASYEEKKFQKFSREKEAVHLRRQEIHRNPLVHWG